MFLTKDILETIIENKKNGTTCVIKNFCADVPSWEEFIQYIEKASCELSEFPDTLTEYDLNLGGKVVGNILIKQGLYLYIKANSDLGNSKKILEDARMLRVNLVLANAYVNLSSNIDSIPPHMDSADNFYWQCQGSVEWEANGNSYLVEPGDLVYIPAKTLHAVKFSVPRAAMGFSAVLEDYISVN